MTEATASSFDERVWACCRRVPRGRVTTYGAIAAALGQPTAARAVGGALNRNPHAPAVPCHRVVGADRRLTGFARGLPAKRAILEAEGVRFVGARVAAECLWNPVEGAVTKPSAGNANPPP